MHRCRKINKPSDKQRGKALVKGRKGRDMDRSAVASKKRLSFSSCLETDTRFLLATADL